jgi:putative mRNA 3-end processing factor
LNQYLIDRPEGLYFEPGDFYLDPQRAVASAVISHAHADHAIASNQEVWCTRPTESFMKLRYKDRLKSKFNILAYHQPVQFGPVTVRLVPAGPYAGVSPGDY